MIPIQSVLEPSRPKLEGTAVLLALSLATYFGVVYAFSFSPGTTPFRHAMHAAILLMDALILRDVARGFRRIHESPAGSGHRRDRIGWLRPSIAAVALVYAAALHGDYAFARWHGAEAGWTGPLVTLQIRLLGAQLVCLLTLRLSRTTPPSGGEVLRSFRARASDLLLPSICLIPLVNYLAHNRELFSFVTAAEYLAFFLIVPVTALLLLEYFQHAFHAEAVGAPVVASLAFVYYSMPLVCSALSRPVESLFLVHVLLALFVPATLGALYRANRMATVKVLAIAAACSVAGSVLQAEFGVSSGERRTIEVSADRSGPADAGLAALLASPLKRTPDVYLLIYDGLAAGEMMKAYGIADDGPADYLKHSGFKVYDGVYSLFPSSVPSMSSLMDMRAASRAAIGGNNTAIAFFHDHGYDTNLILNAYLLQGTSRIAADFVFPRWTPESGLNVLYRGIGGGEFKSEIVFQDYDRGEWLAAKRSVLKATTGRPRMMYAHSGFPGHSQNSGTCLPDETAQYAGRLAVARAEMREDLDAIVSSHRNAIIIVAGDHGPYLTGDCLNMATYNPADLTAAHLADRYGTTLAIRWPDDASGRTDDIEVIQDVFFAVSAYLLDNEQVWAHRVPAQTVGYGGIPDGSIRDGIVMVGKDRGRRLFAKQELFRDGTSNSSQR